MADRSSAPEACSEVPASLRMASTASYLVHIRSYWTAHWPTSGTPYCNDGVQLTVTPDADPTLPVCRRCSKGYASHRAPRQRMTAGA